MSAEQTAFKVFTSIALVLVLLPAPWHWSARNYGTLLYISWTFLGCVICLVNSFLWNGSVINKAPIWCDITTKFTIGFAVAIPAVSLAINRRLYNIATIKHVATSYKEKRKQALIDVGIGLGIPCIVMALHYIVQGHRFDIVEDMGCIPTTYLDITAVFLVCIWPLVLGLISFVYASLSIHAFLRQRRNFNAHVARTSSMNTSRYIRLIALALTDILLDIPLSVFVIYSNTRHGLEPWLDWSKTHYDFSQIRQFPKVILQSESPETWSALELNRWAVPLVAWLFFFYFGLAGESMAAYRRGIQWMVKKLPIPGKWKRYMLPDSNGNKGPSRAKLGGSSKPIGALPLYSKTSSMTKSPTLNKIPDPSPSPPPPNVIRITRSREVILDGGDEDKYSMHEVDVKLTSSCITYSPGEIYDSYAMIQSASIIIPSPGVTPGPASPSTRFGQQQQIQRIPMDVEAQHPSDTDESEWEDDRGSTTDVDHVNPGSTEVDSVRTLAHIVADSPLPLPPTYTPSAQHNPLHRPSGAVPTSFTFPVVFPPSPNINPHTSSFDIQLTPFPTPLPPVLLFPHPPISPREYNGSEETRRHSSPPAFWSTFRFSRSSFPRRQR